MGLAAFHIRFCLHDPVIVFLALGRIGQDLVSRIDDLDDADCIMVSRIAVGVILLGECFVSSTNDFGWRVARHLEIVVMRMNSRHFS